MDDILISRNSSGQLIIWCKNASIAQILEAQAAFILNEALTK